MQKVKILSATAAMFFVLTAGNIAFASAPSAFSKEMPEAAKEELATATEAKAAAEEKTTVEAEKPAEPSLYEQLGGEKAIDAAVDKFYEKVLADDRVNGFFKGVDMDRQRRMQKAFLTFAFGGPNAYAGRDLRAAHAHLVARGLNDTHFDIIVEHLGATLKEMGVKDELIAHAAKVANSVRNDILNK